MHKALSFFGPLGMVAVALLLTACAGVKKDTPEPPPTTVFLDERNRLHYNGPLDKNANEQLFSLYEKSTLKPHTLVISSGGGSVMLGMDLGDWVYENEISIVIDRFCASSCANYIFTAAKRKGLKKDSILLWHGSSWQPDIDALVKEGNESKIAWREREVSFFEKIGVDYRVTVYGIARTHPSFWEYLRALFTNETIIIHGFDYSIGDMGKFGIHNIYLIDGRWDWRKYTKCCNVKRIRLSNDKP